MNNKKYCCTSNILWLHFKLNCVLREMLGPSTETWMHSSHTQLSYLVTLTLLSCLGMQRLHPLLDISKLTINQSFYQKNRLNTSFPIWKWAKLLSQCRSGLVEQWYQWNKNLNSLDIHSPQNEFPEFLGAKIMFQAQNIDPLFGSLHYPSAHT